MQRLYTCRDCFANELNAPGSPFGADRAKTEAELHAALVATSFLNDQVKELEAELDKLRTANRDGFEVDPDQFAAALARALEERWGTPPESWRKRVTA